VYSSQVKHDNAQQIQNGGRTSYWNSFGYISAPCPINAKLGGVTHSQGWRIVRLRHWPRHQNRKFWKLKMADGLLFENSSVFISQPTIVVFFNEIRYADTWCFEKSQVRKFCYSKCRSSTILKIDFRLYLWYCARDRNSCAMPRESAASWCEKSLRTGMFSTTIGNATCNNNNSSQLLLSVKPLSTYWPVLPHCADDLPMQSSSSCNRSRIDGHMTLTFDAYVEHDTLSLQGQKFKGKKAEENAILNNKSAPFSSQHQTRWKYSK